MNYARLGSHWILRLHSNSLSCLSSVDLSALRPLRRWFVTVLLLLPANAFLTPGVTVAEISTERYELPEVDLTTIGNEVALDYFFPPVPARIVTTRFDLTFQTDTPGGFDA